MGASAQQRSFVIRIAFEDRVQLILDFHRDYLTEYLWPRTLEDFESLAKSESLFEAIETTTGKDSLVGICYVMHGNELESPHGERSEFGGVYVTEDCRGLGIATVLGIVAISNHFAWDPPIGRLVAHVHEANLLPRGMLEKQLGFVRVGQEIPPNDVAPPSMARNERGEVVGDIFEFQLPTLVRFADWIEAFVASVDGKAGTWSLDIAVPLMTRFRREGLAALRDLASRP